MKHNYLPIIYHVLITVFYPVVCLINITVFKQFKFYISALLHTNACRKISSNRKSKEMTIFFTTSTVNLMLLTRLRQTGYVKPTSF